MSAHRNRGAPKRANFTFRKSRGFTLLELVVALALLGITTVLLFNGLRLAARSAHAVEMRTRAALDAHLAGLFLRRQVETAQALEFSGERDGLRFVAPLPAHLSPGGMYLFTVGLAQEAGGKQLVLRYELYQAGAWERFGAAQPASTILARQLEDVQFGYLEPAQGAGPATWASRWAEKDRLPQLVRLRLSAGARTQELVMAPKLATSRPGN
jgi:general secretion pathway protein J